MNPSRTQAARATLLKISVAELLDLLDDESPSLSRPIESALQLLAERAAYQQPYTAEYHPRLAEITHGDRHHA